MARVYVVHTGSYSDQNWGPVFSTVARAQGYLEDNQGLDDPKIEIHVLDDENDTGAVYPTWIIVFGKGGDVLTHIKGKSQMYEERLHKPEVRLIPENNRWYFLDGLKDRSKAHLVVENIQAPDLGYATKIGADVRTQFLAMRIEGGSDARI